MYLPTNDEVAIIKQQIKDVYVKVELLDKDFTIIDALTGNLISDNFSMDYSSKQRRSYSCELYLSDYSYTVGPDTKIWLDKYIRVYYGVRSLRSNEVVYWRLGTFTYLNANYTYGATERTLSLQCGDLMVNYDGTKDGIIKQTIYDDITGETSYDFKIVAVNEYKKNADGTDYVDANGERVVVSYQKIKDAIVATLGMAGITQYQIEDYPDGEDTIPYDLEYSGEVTYCTVWTDICNLYPSWEFFFDADGVFIWRKIPTGLDEIVSMDDSIFDQLYIQEQLTSPFTGIYNVTEVWGKTFELTNEDRYAPSSTYSSGTYTIDIPLTAKSNITDTSAPESYLVVGDKIAFKIMKMNAASPQIIIKDSTQGITLTSMPLVDSAGNALPAGTFVADSDGVICVFTYRQNIGTTLTPCLYFNGKTQAYGIYEETSEECPFSTTNLGYKLVKRVSYEGDYSDDLCYNRAEYLTYQTTAMMDSITLNMVIVPWIEVNQKVSYTSKVTNKTEQYIIQNVSWSSLDGTMSVKMYKFLEDFSYVYDRKYGGA